ncbi:MAG TPA: tRNA lysidine(34) synthetase TilS [Bryobacteraceae bacterium]|nr:tRNA lysidine(34) synthetase TilS [Bryobacteraceae bacterium]
MIERVAATIERYGMFRPGDRVGVAVSGGADSVCLLHVLRELAPRWALRLSVLHLDHRLRGEASRADAEFVRQLAAGLSLPFYPGEADVRSLREATGENLEQAARNARRDFFLGFLRSGLLDRVALGHTRSDQAETVMFRLLRGTGLSGLAGILPVTAEGFVRPLLEVSRPEVLAYLGSRGLSWREDATNRDPALARNRIRHQLLPALQRDWNPRLEAALARLAALAQEEEDYWRAETDRLEAAHAVRRGRAYFVRVRPLSELPRPVARRLVRRLIERARGDLRRIEYEHVEQALELARREKGDGRICLPGLVVWRSFDWIRFSPSGEEFPQAFRREVAIPGYYPLPDGGRLQLELAEARAGALCASGYNRGGSHLVDRERIRGLLELRSWIPGDRYRPAGHTTVRNLADLFQRARIPHWERGSWPVLESGGRIVWSRGFGAAAELVPDARTRWVLKISEAPESPEAPGTS